MAPLESPPGTTDLRAVARSLATIVEAGAARSEQQGYLADDTVVALRRSGLFAALLPRCLGGQEADPVTAIDVIAELARADGSAGWTLMAGMVTNAIAAAWFGDDAVQTMFGAGADVVCAGQFAPKGEAHPQEGGYRVRGRFSFGSGARHADWLFGGFRVIRDGAPELLENGLPNVLGVCIPAAGVRLDGNWDVLGLTGTGSYDYEIPDQAVTPGYTFELFAAGPVRGGPLYRLGIHGLTAAGHAGYALGVARRALDEVAALAGRRRRLGARTLVTQETFQRDFAVAEASLRAARAYVTSAFGGLFRSAAADGITLEQRADCRLATTWATRTAAEVTRFAYLQSGSDGLRNPNLIQRCFRDMHAGSQHLFVDENTFVDAARVLLGTAEPSLVI
ncbi:MAG TPA: acyl-CoA dehydrogenase family protein [Acidimicrobiia bacterium]|nr:acyl-CoA dehydrogenase family protein [Acidimicrobiia bacterium]